MPKISVITPTIRPEGLVSVYHSLKNQTFTDFEWLVEVGFPSKGNDLNRAYNRLIRRSQGELIVSIQDFTTFGHTTLQELWETNDGTFYTIDVAHSDGEHIEYDWRHFEKGKPVEYNRLEICMASMPKKGLYDIGGFDEELDELTWGFDNVNLGYRVAQKGYKIAVHPTAEAVQFKHDLKIPHPFRDKMNGSLHESRLGQIKRGEVTINYLVV